MRTDQALAPGTRLQNGRYHLTNVIGAGGFSIVYRAMQGRRKPVAIKELFPNHAARRTVLGIWTRKRVRPTRGWEDLLQSMREEFRLVHRLKHPNIVRVHELFAENGTLYLVMELLDGETLHERILQHPNGLPETAAVPIVTALASALTYAHTQAGILHRDVKPGNVMLTTSGRPVLLDFGLAATLHSLTTRERSGTTATMAPEQVRGEQQSARTDVFGLAATAYYLLTGSAPPSAADRLKSDGLVPPDQVRPGISPAVSDAILRGLALNPAERTPSCRAFIADLSGSFAFTVRSSVRDARWGWMRGLLVAVVLGVLTAAWSGCPNLAFTMPAIPVN